MPLDGPARPWSKEQALARSGKRYHRQKAGAARWTQIAEAKQGPCRGCGIAPPNQLAHLISRSQGAPDSEWNIAALCISCHAKFDQRDPETCAKVAARLTDQEYAGLIAWGGETIIEQRFLVRYERP